MKHLVEQDTHRPDIRLVVVGPSGVHLWRYVLQSSAERVSLGVFLFYHDTPAKIAELGVAFLVQENVLGFYVSMKDVFGVKVLQGLQYLLENFGPLFVVSK